MKLQNPFPLEVRLLYIDWWECFLCGGNGQGYGGIEIHHILGRVSSSVLNSSCLCKRCHAQISHNREEHQKIFAILLKFLDNRKQNGHLVVLKKDDLEFLEQNKHELIYDKHD